MKQQNKELIERQKDAQKVLDILRDKYNITLPSHQEKHIEKLLDNYYKMESYEDASRRYSLYVDYLEKVTISLFNNNHKLSVKEMIKVLEDK